METVLSERHDVRRLAAGWLLLALTALARPLALDREAVFAIAAVAVAGLLVLWFAIVYRHNHVELRLRELGDLTVLPGHGPESRPRLARRRRVGILPAGDMRREIHQFRHAVHIHDEARADDQEVMAHLAPAQLARVVHQDDRRAGFLSQGRRHPPCHNQEPWACLTRLKIKGDLRC